MDAAASYVRDSYVTGLTRLARSLAAINASLKRWMSANCSLIE